MVQIEGTLTCSECKEESILDIFDKGRKEVRLYVNPRLPKEKVHGDVKIKKCPIERGKYYVIVTCPVCLKPSIKLGKFPYDWKVLESPHELTLVKLDELPPEVFVSKHEPCKKNLSQMGEGEPT